MSFSSTILQWYKQNKRDLPWRKTKDPYKIWLSEIMLQQTRVAQGLPYYLKFVETFPKVHNLANAPEEKVLKLWQGLGYYSRARNLHATAKHVAFNLNGIFPDNYKDLLQLKGVGDYTASAIASICFNEEQPVVDGNVYRVLARYFGVNYPINSTKGIAYFKQLAREVIDAKEPATFNQAIMEFGAVQCKPQSPNCSACPLNNSCEALAKKRVNELPVKLKKAKIAKKHFNFFVVIDASGNTLLQERTQKGIWQKLFQFPLVETTKEINIETAKQALENLQLFKGDLSISKYNKECIVHKLSHQHLYTTFWVVHLQSELKESIPINTLEKYPVPVLIANFIEEASFL